ncbi:MAG: alpha/beta hydrolase [Aggregatilineales bacterium]
MAVTSSHSTRKRRVRLLRIFIIAVVLALAIAMLVPFAIGYSTTWATTRAGCAGHPDDPETPALFNLPYKDVSVPARWGGAYRGFFVAGPLDATIIIPPTGSGGRDGALHELAMIAGHGYNVLTYEARVCVGKPISMGYREVDDVGDAIDYLQRNPDKLPVKLDHIGLYGFSTAGATATMATARYPQIGALVTVGNYATLADMVGTTAPKNVAELFIGLGFRLAYWLSTGEDPANLNPLAAIVKVPPRPVLFIYGSLELSLPGAKLQLAAIRAADPNESAELWIVPGSDHGGYFEVVGVNEVARHVLPFFDCALLTQNCDQYHALWRDNTNGNPFQTF